jgi:preprotein translocase subunit YajC
MSPHTNLVHTAFVQAALAPAGAPGGGIQDMILQFAPMILIFGVGYFILFRPMQQRQKAHQEAVKGVKRGDTVVLASGVIGAVSRVDETECTVEIAPKIEVKVVKSMITDVRTRGTPVVANDAKK